MKFSYKVNDDNAIRPVLPPGLLKAAKAHCKYYFGGFRPKGEDISTKEDEFVYYLSLLLAGISKRQGGKFPVQCLGRWWAHYKDGLNTAGPRIEIGIENPDDDGDDRTHEIKIDGITIPIPLKEYLFVRSKAKIRGMQADLLTAEAIYAIVMGMDKASAATRGKSVDTELERIEKAGRSQYAGKIDNEIIEKMCFDMLLFVMGADDTVGGKEAIKEIVLDLRKYYRDEYQPVAVMGIKNASD